MVWIDTKEISSPILSKSPIIEVIDIVNTSLVAVLTQDSIIIIHQQTLLPLAGHFRTIDSLELHGNNKRLKIKNLSLGLKATKLNIVNLFLITDNDYLIIYQLTINPNSSIFDIYDSNSSTYLQTLLPVNTNVKNNGFTRLLENLTRNITTGDYLNLESVENFNNYKNIVNLNVDLAKLMVYRTIKVGIGIDKFYLKSNSHNLFVYNNFFLQVINIKTMNNEVFKIIDFDWYNRAVVEDIWYDHNNNFFLFANELQEIWQFSFGEGLEPQGYKLDLKLNIKQLRFNPVNHLIFVETKDGVLSIYKFRDQLVHCIDLNVNWAIKGVQWSNDGEFLVLLNDRGHWLLCSKFGNIFSNTEEISNEINDDVFLADHCLVSHDNNSLILVNDSTKQIFKVNLVRLINSKDLILLNSNYFTIVDSIDNKLIKYPLLTDFKYKPAEDLKISKNINNQFIISGSDKLAVSNPYKSGTEFNHVVWFNFKNYYMETLNIIDHLNYRQFLILVNKTTEEGVHSKIINEIIIINLQEDSLYGAGGQTFHFDSDLFIWRRKFADIITIELCDNKLIILDVENKLYVFELLENYTNKVGHNYKFYMKLNQTIDLSTMKDKITLSSVCKIQLLANLNFLLLLDTGEFYMLKNESNKILLTTYFQLIKINFNIEDFNVNEVEINDEIIRYIYLFQGPKLLIYNLTHLIELIFNPVNDPVDGLDDIEDSDEEKESLELTKQLINPIIIDLDDFQPLKIQKNANSINLIGLQDLITNSEFLRVDVTSHLILNNLIEFDLKNKVNHDIIINKFGAFKNFDYCLELLLFNYLSHKDNLIHRLVDLIKAHNNYEIFINCLRKIEFQVWSYFFKVFGATPIEFMKLLIDQNNVKLGYMFLIIYLNLKSDNEDDKYLDGNDEKIIMNLFERLVKMNYWDWCFEMCRFIKLLDPSSKLLIRIKESIEGA